MQELTTYFDDTRYDNLTSLMDAGNIRPDGLSAKPAKLSALGNFRTKANNIKQELRKNNEVTVEPEAPTANVESASKTPVATEATVPDQEETQKVQFPTREVLESRIEGLGVTIYNELKESKNDSEVASRKLRVAPQVTENVKYTMNTIGIEQVLNTTELSENSDIQSELTTYASPEETELTAEEPVAYDFGALPGVGTTEPVEQSEMAYEENIHTEQDDRLNDYLNRESNMDNNMDYSSNITELEEIRKLKREIEEARESLLQVKQNVGDLQQKDNVISEQLAAYKRSLMKERDAVNAELVDQTREWNDLTQLLKQKEAIIGEEESFGIGRSA